MRRGARRAFRFFAPCLLAVLLPAGVARGHVTKITVEKTETRTQPGGKGGAARSYEILTGHAFGELDPKNPLNAIITDIQLAPRNSRGKVEYVATFTLVKPSDVAKASGTLLYEVANRGNSPLAFPGYPIQDSLNAGDAILLSGWQGDVAPAAGMESIQVPVARNPGGESITGPVLARLYDLPAGSHTASLANGFGGLHYQRPVTLDTSKATLVTLSADDATPVQVAASDWAFADCTAVAFPGTPDPTKICVKQGFDPALLYQLTFTAKDPLVLGIGLAATRDIVSFFRHAERDEAGTPNPTAGMFEHAVAFGTSQSGNFLKTFLNLGFNEDEEHRIVWDGMNSNISGRQTPINIRFAIPGGATTFDEPGSEGVVWWSDYRDEARHRAKAGLLDRCRASHTCPKIFETFGATEFWDLRMSPDLAGTKADGDIPLPENVRRYYFPGTTHGGGRGGFASSSAAQPGCSLESNPNPSYDMMRALRQELIAWVVKGTEPPPSEYPRIDNGELVQPTAAAMGFPKIPGVAAPDALINPFYDYDFGSEFRYNDFSGVISRQPPATRQVMPERVPRVDGDGNEVGGIGSPLFQAPLGTYLGWNVTAGGCYRGKICGFTGGYIPFAKTKAERLAAADPRLSLEERYASHEDYVGRLKAAAERLVKDRFLLREDADRIVSEAEASDVRR
jgi:hypothetical protein